MGRKRVMTTGEAARRIGVSGAYINALIHKGKLKAERTPLGFLLDPDSVEDFKRERDAKLAGRPQGADAETADDGFRAKVPA